MQITNLRTEYKINPLGIEVLQPRLSWMIESDEFEVKQEAYRILVASTAEKLMGNDYDLWDSGTIKNDQAIQNIYAGTQLYSEQLCYWKVEVWTNKSEESISSEMGFWSMGLLSAQEWRADWIGMKREPDIEHLPARYLRKEFSISKPIHRATVYSTALGVYELHFNGNRINDLFAPGWTDYEKRVQYETHDVTSYLSSESNVIGIVLGSGWYAGHVGMSGTCWYGDTPYALLQLHIEYTDGTKEVIGSDQSWKTSTGPLIYSDMIMGETYDATKELGDWTKSNYNQSNWSDSDILSSYEGVLQAILEPPIQVTEEMKPVSITKTESGSYIFDMGQNMVGWAAIKIKGPKGHKITLSYAEMLNPDGTLYIANLRDAVQQDHYFMRGDQEEETYEPHFTFHGFRYVEVIGSPYELTTNDLIGKVIHSTTTQVGTFETSDPMINRLFKNIEWGQRGNFLSVPTDCPQRDERLGWTGDAQIFIRTASYNSDVAGFFTKYLVDVTDAQLSTGAFPDVAPDGGWIWFKTTEKKVRWLAPDNAGWGDAGVIIPWTLYQVYHDKRILEQMYPAMEKWIDYLKNGSTNLIRPDHGDYGDWLSINSVTPNEVVGTAYFAYSTQLMAKISRVLGKEDDEQKYDRLFKDIRTAFNQAFVDDNGRISGDSQTVYILALRFGLLEGDRIQQALSYLVDDIRKQNNHISTGFLGVGHILPVLSDHGEDELAYALLQQESFPSWLYSVKHDATTIWERWDGWTEEHGFQNPGTNSFNHYALGSVGEWMYRYMAGIDLQQPGYQHTTIRPRIGGGLTYVKADYTSIYGKIASSWKLEKEQGLLEVSIPANTTADIYVPNIFNRQVQSITSGAVFVKKLEDGTFLYRVGSGNYQFQF